jgi:hypothetical protein
MDGLKVRLRRALVGQKRWAHVLRAFDGCVDSCGCPVVCAQIKLPAATRNMYVDGHVPKVGEGEGHQGGYSRVFLGSSRDMDFSWSPS